jgi:hypothetical protein
MLTRIRSVSVVTHAIEETVQLYRDLYDLPSLPVQEVQETGWLRTVCPMQNTELEFLQPALPGSQAVSTAERMAEGLYGIRFESDDLDGDVARLKQHGAHVYGETDSGSFRTARVSPESFLGIRAEIVQSKTPETWPGPRNGQEAYRRPSTVLRDIRQVITLVKDRDAAGDLFNSYFGLGWRDGGVHGDLLVNFVPMPTSGTGSNSVLALAQPNVPGGPGQRYLERNGEGPYALTLEAFDLDRLYDRARASGIQPIRPQGGSQGRTDWFHPRSVGGVYTMVTESRNING